MLTSHALGEVAAAPSAPAPAAVRPAYDIEILHDPEAARLRLAAAFASGAATPFQAPDWLSTWYATVGPAHHAEPLLVFVSERGTGRRVAALPLIRHRTGGLEVVAFADLGVTDYNAPILGPAAPTSADAARAMWSSIAAALPPADLIQLRKMPGSVRGEPNPMVALRGAHVSHSPGFSVAMPEAWDTYLQSLSKKFRKELGRSLRRFEEGGGGFRRIETMDEAKHVLRTMNEQQRGRLEEMGTRFALEEKDYHAFYEDLVGGGLQDGTTILTALTCGDELVAALLGIADATSFTMVRLSHIGGDWMKVGPGRLVIERTMRLLHARGCRQFGFSIGDYPYKSGFGVEPSPLFDLVIAQSWRGRFSSARNLAKVAVKRGLKACGVSLVPQAVKNRYRRYHQST